MSRSRLCALLPAAGVLVPSLAVAHSGPGEASGFIHGFAHPMGGLDHILAMVMVGVLKFMFASHHTSSIILLATSETRTLSLLALDQVAAGYREVASITVILIMTLTLGVAIISRSLGLKVGIRAE